MAKERVRSKLNSFDSRLRSRLCSIKCLEKDIMRSEAPTWADQWGSGGMDDYYDKQEGNDSKSNKGKKMANVKAAASSGLDKAKSAASVGAQKVKSGTSMSISWIKNKCQKKSSK
ncbi:hypothetical protein KFK09_002963 [Dendrobium nobile]|uniref:Uncharacterized protein n=1 Tax=Dendrobium nobile TaxID=94219 RepID=A0A8T3C8Q9_DENNO|nr:hypothetical protein KFK09_002963 [Dendrobium nobile]